MIWYIEVVECKSRRRTETAPDRAAMEALPVTWLTSNLTDIGPLRRFSSQQSLDSTEMPSRQSERELKIRI